MAPNKVVNNIVWDALWEAYAEIQKEGWPLLQQHALHVYNCLVEIYVYPTNLVQVGISCLSFFVLMLSICFIVEVNNPNSGSPGRWKQIRNEIAESFPACVCSTSISLVHLKYAYPLRWGFKAPVFPSSFSLFLFECAYWMLCFEVSVYGLHRFLHWRKPIDMYRLIHRQHHLFFFPSAFAAQAIHPVEAMLFAETSLIASVFLFPISVATQYICGVLLLIWSILAHDSQFVLDQGMHFEHHSHQQTNFGFLGLFSLFFVGTYCECGINLNLP